MNYCIVQNNSGHQLLFDASSQMIAGRFEAYTIYGEKVSFSNGYKIIRKAKFREVYDAGLIDKPAVIEWYGERFKIVGERRGLIDLYIITAIAELPTHFYPSRYAIPKSFVKYLSAF